MKIARALFLLVVWSPSTPLAAAQSDRIVINGGGSTFA
jgi:hypothetical protein